MNHRPDNYLRLPMGILDSLLLFIFALVARLSILSYWVHLPLVGDERYYWDCAISVASGKLPISFLRPPLWGYVLGVAASISNNPAFGRLLTTFISSLAVPIVYLIGTRIFSRKVGIIAGVIYLVYPNNIGFSHYLWAEPLFALLVLVSTYFFFEAIHEKVKPDMLYLSILVAGLSLLAKEFAVVLFASFITVLITLGIRNKKRLCIFAAVIFLTPAIVYSIGASASARRPVILADAFIYNANQVNHGISVFKNTPKENIRILLNESGQRFYQIPANSVRYFYGLWTPSSFSMTRLLRIKGYYHVYATALVYVIAVIYIFIVLTGLAGICFGDNTPFRTFAICNLAYLSSLSAMFHLCSRFRLPFMFIFILYSSAVISDPRTILKRLKCWHRVLAWIVLSMLFVHIVVTKWSMLGVG